MPENILPKNYNVSADHLEQANLHFEAALHQKARAEAGLVVAEKLTPLDRAVFYKLMGKLENADQNHETARFYFERSIKVLESVAAPDRLEIERVRCWIGATYNNQNLPAKAIEHFSTGLHMMLVHRLNNPELQAHLFCNLGTAYKEINNLRQAYTYFKQALDVCESGDFNWVKGNALNGMAAIYRYSEDWEAARAYFYRSMKAFEDCHSQYWAVNSRQDLADVLLMQGKLEEAEALSLENLPQAYQYKNLGAAAYCHYNLAEIKMRQGLIDEAETENERSLKIARYINNRPKIGHCIKLKGEILVRQGRAAESLSFFEEALEIFNAARLDRHARIVYQEYFIALSALERWEQALEMKRRAMELTMVGQKALLSVGG